MTTAQTVKTMRQMEVVSPQLVARALPALLFKDLKIENPPPILFKKFEANVFGFCMPGGFVESGEIVLHDFLSDTIRTVPETIACREMADVYIHEISHRLAPEGSGHNAVFATINLALLLRAESCYPSFFHKLQLYDFHEHFVTGATVDASAAFSFIIKNAEVLAASDLTAEKIAIEAVRRWTHYEADVLAMPARQAAKISAVDSMKERFEQAQAAKWQFLAVGLLVGTVIVKLLG